MILNWMELITCLMVTEPLQLITSMLPSVRGVHKFSDADNITTPYRGFLFSRYQFFAVTYVKITLFYLQCGITVKLINYK